MKITKLQHEAFTPPFAPNAFLIKSLRAAYGLAQPIVCAGVGCYLQNAINLGGDAIVDQRFEQPTRRRLVLRNSGHKVGR